MTSNNVSTSTEGVTAPGITRRHFVRAAGFAGASLAVPGGRLAASPKAAPDAEDRKPGRRPAGPYNILFVLTDQERHLRPADLPAGFSLPGRERLRREGVDRKSVV